MKTAKYREPWHGRRCATFRNPPEDCDCGAVPPNFAKHEIDVLVGAAKTLADRVHDYLMEPAPMSPDAREEYEHLFHEALASVRAVLDSMGDRS